ncbi:hypothetical protein Tco_1425773 [Tanacetum coccineum]
MVHLYRHRNIFTVNNNKQPQPQPPKDNRKRVAKRVTVDLVDEDEEEEELIRQCARWTRDEEILLTECWIETSENGQIGADRTDYSFWGHIMDDFNSATTQGYRTKHMLTGKWTMITGDCQKFNAIYKHIERKSGENKAHHIEAAKVIFAAQQPKGIKFQLEHAWRILKGHSKWDAPKPLDIEDHIEILGPETRPRPAVGTSAYEEKKQKELAMMEFKEMEFLMIDADQLPEPKARIIRKRQEKIIAKYAQE